MSKIFSTLATFLVKGKAIALLLMNYLVILVYKPGNTGGILLIRLDHIGDFILWLDTAKLYRQLYPNQNITLVANTSWLEVAKALPYWDKVIELNTVLFDTNWLYRWKLLRAIRQIGFETAIQPTYSRNFLLGDSLIHITGSRHRIGSQGDCNNICAGPKHLSDRWYTQLVAASGEEQMELDRNAEFISNLTGSPYSANLPVIPGLLNRPEHLLLKQSYCVIFPGASWIGKQWPPEKFAETAKILNAEKNWQIVIAGSQNDRTICNKVAEYLDKDVTINLCGRTSLLELIELIRYSAMLISNDTSAIHIAAAVGAPAVCILGGGHFGRFLPYSSGLEHAPIAVFHEMPCFGCKWQCTQSYIDGEAVPCIRNVSVQSVCDAISEHPKIKHV